MELFSFFTCKSLNDISFIRYGTRQVENAYYVVVIDMINR